MSAAAANPWTFAARLDRLPVLPAHIVWIIILAVNLGLEYYDNALFAYVMPAIADGTGLTLPQLGAVSSAFFVGMVLGAIGGGRLADRFGRRPVLVWATALYSAGALVTALSSDFSVMMTSRFVTGLGVQAATSVLMVYVTEMFPSKVRGRFVSMMTFGFVLIAPTVAFVAMVVIPNGGPDTWRHLFMIGSVGLVIAALVRAILPESVRWQLSTGRTADAEATVTRLEEVARKRGRTLSEPESVLDSGVADGKGSLRSVLADRKVLRAIAIVSIGYFGTTLGYYLFANWGLYALVNGLGYDEEKAYSVQFIWNIVYCATPVIAILLIDRMERKTLILATSIVSAVPLVLLGVSTNSWFVTASGGVAAITTGLVFTAFYVYGPESVPTHGRGLGSGIIMSVGRAGGAVSGVLGASLFGHGGIGGVMIAAAVCYILFSAFVFGLGPRTANRSLEQLSVDQQSVERTDAS